MASKQQLQIWKKRRQKIVRQRDKGSTFQAIADDMGISRERVRQLYYYEVNLPLRQSD